MLSPPLKAHEEIKNNISSINTNSISKNMEKLLEMTLYPAFAAKINELPNGTDWLYIIFHPVLNNSSRVR